MKRSFIREILEHTTAQTISFAGGLPDESLFPLQALQEAAQKALLEANSLQYTTSQGYEPLRQKIAELYTADGFATNKEEIMITSGSQQALDIISRFYANAAITVEAPSYLGAMNVFTLNKLKQTTVVLETDGIDIDAFEKSFQTSKLAYLIPDFQNPTGTSYTQTKREKIAQIVKDTGGVLIEDSPYSLLYFTKPYRPISEMVADQSYHLGSFSKTLAPALRVGWIRANPKLLKELLPYKEAMDLHTNGVAQRIIYAYLQDTQRYKKHLATLRSAYSTKMKFFAQTLDTYLPMFEYTKPEGGMFIYGRLPQTSTSDLVQEALQKDLVFVPGREFYTEDTNKDDEIRFNFTRSSKEEILKGIQTLRSLLK